MDHLTLTHLLSIVHGLRVRSVTELLILALLIEGNGRVSVPKIKRMSIASEPTVRKYIDALCHRGVCTLARHPEDSRAQMLVVTERGRAIIAQWQTRADQADQTDLVS